ncbi:MAG: serine protease, partial [Bacteroidia bacterium]|nr:serine protease [Bacteroidia bacterium]MDW8334666.1 serine protease [Bacteroidia bacterium]
MFGFCLILLNAACAQVVYESGLPAYWNGGEPWVSVFVPPIPDRQRLIEEDLEEAGLNRPFRFAQAVPVKLNSKTAGRWDGDTWFCEVYAPGAVCLAFVFDRFELPPGGRFFAYTPERDFVRGPFTWRNNYEHFAIAPLPGDRVYLEYTGPAPSFNIRSVSYGYKNVFFSRSGNKSFGDSGPCQVNTVCPLAADWQDEKRGVALLLTDGMTRICSSSLINNVRQDGRAYVLTADHCLDGNVPTWAAMFNYESPTCSPNQDGPTDQIVQGAALRARLSDSDMALVEFNDRPQNFYQVYFNGWNRQDIPSPNATVIHHPAGDVKKISFDYHPVVSSDYFGANPPNSHWKVVNYEVASTEPGSSGSPLFDHQSRIIGQLHGGESWCDVQEADEYGKFSYSWATYPQPERQLKFWLDPDNTGVSTLDGAYIAPQPVVQFSASQNQAVLYTGCVPPSITFVDESEGIANPTTYTWEFP